MRTSADTPESRLQTTGYFSCPKCGGTKIELIDDAPFCTRCKFGSDIDDYRPPYPPAGITPKILWNLVVEKANKIKGLDYERGAMIDVNTELGRYVYKRNT